VLRWLRNEARGGGGKGGERDGYFVVEEV